MSSLLVSLLLISQCVYDSKTIDTKKIIRKCQKAVVKVALLTTVHDTSTREDYDALKPVASGFFISKYGYILTAKHVTDSLKVRGQSAVITYEGEILQTSLLQPYPPDLGVEIGILKLDKPINLPYLSIAKVKSLELGEGVVVLGYPIPELTITQGIIIALSSSRDSFRISASISPGSSGSPVLNSDGKVIGIATFSGSQWREDGNVAALFGVAANPIKYRKKILDFIEQHRNMSKR